MKSQATITSQILIGFRTCPLQKVLFVLSCLLLTQLPGRAQEVTPKEKQYLQIEKQYLQIEKQSLQSATSYFKMLGFPVQGYAFDDVGRNRLLSDILLRENQREGKLTAGIMFALAGAGLMVAGAAYKPANGLEGLFDFTGPALFVSGLGFELGSIPFFIISGQRARQRNQAIERARLEFLN